MWCEDMNNVHGNLFPNWLAPAASPNRKCPCSMGPSDFGSRVEVLSPSKSTRGSFFWGDVMGMWLTCACV